MAKHNKKSLPRPMPPTNIGIFAEDAGWATDFMPAPEVREWAKAMFIVDGAILENPDHAHLQDASIEFLWAATGFVKAQNRVVGQCEELSFRCGPWQRGRQEQQMLEWFGQIPEYLITLDASFAAQCSDAEFMAVVEHELMHIGQALDEFGQPKFDKASGQPKLCIRGHDVEEFVGIVRRYGLGSGKTAELIAAAAKAPEVSTLDVARACGTCMLRAA